MKITWYELLEKAFRQTGDDFSIFKSTVSEEQLRSTNEELEFEAEGVVCLYFPYRRQGEVFIGCQRKSLEDRKISWYELLKKKFNENNDDFSNMIITLTDEQLHCKHEVYSLTHNYYRIVETNIPFTAWGDIYVYFPICYDGKEWVGCAPRNPCDIKMKSQGG